MENYVKKAMRTYDRKSESRLTKILLKKYQIDCKWDLGGILDGCLGLAGEVGEFVDLVKKWIFHEHPIDEEHLKKELGDICWYVALICFCFGWDLQEILDLNIRKLEQRYPEGFDVDQSKVRKEGDI